MMKYLRTKVRPLAEPKKFLRKCLFLEEINKETCRVFKLTCYIIIILLLPVITHAVAHAETMPPTLRTTAEVNRASVQLGDIFDGLPAALAQRSIATAPAAGRRITWDTRVLAKLARDQNINWRPNSITDQVIITRRSARLDADAVRKTVLEQVKQSGFAEGDNAILDIDIDGRVMETEWASDTPPDFKIDRLRVDNVSRRFRSELVVSTGDGETNVPISGRINVQIEIPVIAAKIDAGAVISERDIAIRTFPIERVNRDIVRDKGAVIGREAARAIAEGQMLRASDLRAQRLVSRGETVTLKVETTYMQITSKGKALQDGAKGETIRVNNLQGQKVIEGVVESAGVVLVSKAGE